MSAGELFITLFLSLEEKLLYVVMLIRGGGEGDEGGREDVTRGNIGRQILY